MTLEILHTLVLSGLALWAAHFAASCLQAYRARTAEMALQGARMEAAYRARTQAIDEIAEARMTVENAWRTREYR